MRNTRVIYVLNQGGELSSQNIEFLLVLNEVCSSNSMYAQKEQATSSVLNNRTCKILEMPNVTHMHLCLTGTDVLLSFHSAKSGLSSSSLSS